jgi:Methylamine utilisation protein MauE
LAGLCQWFLVTIFVGAALGKVGSHHTFLRTLVAIPWLPLRGARVAARGVPIFELAVAAALIAAPRAGAIAALATLGAFTAVVTVEVAAGRRFACACFGGAAARPADGSYVVRNAILVAAAVALVARPDDRPLGAALVGVGAGFALLLVELTVETFRAREAS